VKFKIDWMDGGREPRCPSDPAYPDGILVDMTKGETPGCVANLAYPAPRCGMWFVECLTCGFTVFVTAAGRRDDPAAVRIPCCASRVRH
jgi:hypothetical protein